MRKSAFLVFVAIVSGILPACASISSAKNAAISRVLSRGGEYCATTTPAQREGYRSQIDRGRGPIIEIHCDRM